MLQTLLTSILAFVSTNIDDIFILMLFYATGRYKSWQIVAGQYLGIATLVVVSFIGAYIGSFFDQRYIGLLGLFPIYLAVKQWISLWKGAEDDDEQVAASGGVISLAGVTIANGGDNIGVYIPVFATMTFPERLILIAVFAVMIYLWCMLAKYLAHHPLVAKALGKYSHVLMPIVLFLLGIYILYESDSFSLLY